MSVTIQETLAHLRRRQAAEKAAAEERACRLLARVPAAADALRALGARRVWLFGSLVEGGVHGRSDVDLAVEGLNSVGWVDALGRLSQLLGCDFDLVRMEEASPSLRQRIVEEGVPA